MSDQLSTYTAAERELELIVESIERYEQAELGTVDADEYDKLLDHYHKLRSQRYGPQPYTGRNK